MHDDPIQGDLASTSAGHTEAIGHRASMVVHHPTIWALLSPALLSTPPQLVAPAPALTVPLEKLDLFSLPGIRAGSFATQH